tara:strand:+ start:535 stop:645 length:111 start_codon:yes stop_codon:yes gene_type:complete
MNIGITLEMIGVIAFVCGLTNYLVEKGVFEEKNKNE